ncbi:putative transcriptional regulatory protein C1F7.11c [Mycena sanguinolenta]|uniref:Putative transcriptional regulatory protein C1F7.11c n=1 Tax=Mycena sanguinolenta TaxID=230812 RepID=A0A8H6Z6Q2_9AGAR|nr:putative transcriptional regulatory protein C1F7.11c [Mycena sanguinolenta]
MASSLPYPPRPRRRNLQLSCSECRREARLRPFIHYTLIARANPGALASFPAGLRSRRVYYFPFTLTSNCVKKGCAAICPDGSLTTGKGNRFVLADTEVLHEKIGELSNRVRQLEDGLAQSHSLHSLQSHPLLTPELLKIKRPLERERLDVPKEQKPDTNTNEGVDAMGSLSISEGGRSTFFGQAANSWYLLQNERGSGDENEPPDVEPAMPTDIPWIAYAFPFSANISKTGKDVRQNLINLLPRTSVAQRFCDIYYRHAAWMYTPINESDFYETIFRPIYDDTSGGSYTSVSSHCLAVLYMVLALGTLVDLDMPPHSPEANAQATEYYQLSRAALAIDSVLEEPTIAGIQALVLMCHYMFWADIEGPRWVLMGLVVKLAHSVGLHRDSNLWNLDPGETYRRRCLLYEIYTYDSFQVLTFLSFISTHIESQQSLTFGRPPSFSIHHIDTKRPHESGTNPSPQDEMSYAAWKHRWSYECLSVVHDRIFGARSPAYSTVRELDKKRTQQIQWATNLRRPSWPLILAHAHMSASSRASSNSTPALTERMWFYFMHVFSCAIVLGSIAIKPQMALAPSALSHLEAACSLFERVSDRPRTAKILPILHKLRTSAHEALNPDSRNIHSVIRAAPKIKTEIDELAALGGGTRLVTRRATSSTPSRSGSDPTSLPASPSPAYNGRKPARVAGLLPGADRV